MVASRGLEACLNTAEKRRGVWGRPISTSDALSDKAAVVQSIFQNEGKPLRSKEYQGEREPGDHEVEPDVRSGGVTGWRKGCRIGFTNRKRLRDTLEKNWAAVRKERHASSPLEEEREEAMEAIREGLENHLKTIDTQWETATRKDYASPTDQAVIFTYDVLVMRGLFNDGIVPSERRDEGMWTSAVALVKGKAMKGKTAAAATAAASAPGTFGVTIPSTATPLATEAPSRSQRRKRNNAKKLGEAASQGGSKAPFQQLQSERRTQEWAPAPYSSRGRGSGRARGRGGRGGRGRGRGTFNFSGP